MKLHTLFYGKNKKKLKPIMVDSLHKCELYKKARENNVRGFHVIRPGGDRVWRQKTATIGGNKPIGVPVIGKGVSVYVNRNGFNPHT